MRKLWIISAGVFLLLAAGYAVYWYQVAQVFEQNLAAWPEQWRSQGYQVTMDRSAVHGFPWRLRSSIDRFELRSPPESGAWSLSRIHGTTYVTAEPWNPLGFGVELDRRQSWLLSDGLRRDQLSLLSHEAYARVDLALNGQVRRIGFSSLRVWLKPHNSLRLPVREVQARLVIEVASAPDARADASFLVRLNDVTIDPSPSPALGNLIKRIELQGYITGQYPGTLSSHALAQWRDGGGVVEVSELLVNWGPLAVTADTTITLDQDLQPLMAGTAIVRGHDQAIDALVVGGLMNQAQATTTKIALAAMADTDEGGAKVRLPITIQDGFLYLGPLKVAAVPRIDWRM